MERKDSYEGVDFRALYDDHIPEYVERRQVGSASAQRVALEVAEFKIPNLLAVLPENFKCTSVAEIGCATGELIAQFPGVDVRRKVGFDLSVNNITAARARFPAVTFTTEDFLDFGERFDVVILSDILEHVPNDVDLLSKAARIARLLLVNLPLEKCLAYSLRKYGPRDASGHLRSYSLREGMGLFEAAQLTVTKMRRVWVTETEYELLRRKLNKDLCGTEFSGSQAVRLLKRGVFAVASTVRPLGRLVFASNLFVSAELARSSKP